MIRKILAIALALVFAGGVSAQIAKPGIDPATGLPLGVEPPALPIFNLNFPGGSPELFIEYINEELRNIAPLNAIIPKEYADIQVPPMKLIDVNVQQVFEALGSATSKLEHWTDQNNRIQTSSSSFTFQTAKPVTKNSIWYLLVQKPNPREEPKMCRYYQLAPYLESGLDVNDITTAIKAGYKMLGETNAPELNFHKETQLLIAVAPQSKLMLIDDVLRNLAGSKASDGNRRIPRPGSSQPGLPAPPPVVPQ